MKEVGIMDKCMEKVYINGQMVIYLMETMRMDLKMDLVNITKQMGDILKGFG